jgi:hypothetical protein
MLLSAFKRTNGPAFDRGAHGEENWRHRAGSIGVSSQSQAQPKCRCVAPCPLPLAPLPLAPSPLPPCSLAPCLIAPSPLAPLLFTPLPLDPTQPHRTQPCRRGRAAGQALCQHDVHPRYTGVFCVAACCTICCSALLIALGANLSACAVPTLSSFRPSHSALPSAHRLQCQRRHGHGEMAAPHRLHPRTEQSSERSVSRRR